MFILLSGYPPFYGEKDAEILAKVRKGKFSFPTESDDGVEFSSAAKDLISKMLTYEEDARVLKIDLFHLDALILLHLLQFVWQISIFRHCNEITREKSISMW